MHKTQVVIRAITQMIYLSGFIYLFIYITQFINQRHLQPLEVGHEKEQSSQATLF